jgi:glycosyltransferase involved in cell wall biosynthesis
MWLNPSVRTARWRRLSRPPELAAGDEADPGGAVRVLRVIARMNVGGPAYHVSLLNGRLDRERYTSLLVHGTVGPGEASFEDLAREEGCAVQVVGQLGPEIKPVSDIRAFVAVLRAIRRFRPHILHTHTAKAGLIGRLAAWVMRPRPIVVHTFHGHVLEGYFGRFTSYLYRQAERCLARASDCLIGVSGTTVEDLVRLGVAPRERFRVVPVGLDLERFAAAREEDGERFRRQVGAKSGEMLLASVGRLVPIKRLDVLLRAVSEARGAGARLRLAIVGDGQCRAELETLADELGLREVVRFTGYVEDVAPVAAAADVAVLSSDNEGTPVSLIEAGAAGTPAVATAVGGVPDVVEANETGFLVPPGDHQGFAEALTRLAANPELCERMGARAQQRVQGRFSSERLVSDVDALYQELLGAREPSDATLGYARSS